MNQPYNIYMIAISDHPVSQMYLREVLPSWKDYKVTKFEAITPKDLVYKNKLTFGLKSTEREFTATEKAVWYSHFELWCQCIVKGPLIVVEHDSKLVKPLPDLSKEGYKFLSFLERDFGEKGKHMAPGSGYYITPPVAERLVARAVANPIRQNSDGHLGTFLNYKRQISMNDFYYIEQINFDGLNTIDHKNPNRKFIGPDYENFDIPSVHRKAI
jgi:hypothetical protein